MGYFTQADIPCQWELARAWQVYQEEDNYDDNALAWFKQFASAPSASPLWQRGMRKGTAGWFETDARAGRLPQVSWLVAPTAQSEHPCFRVPAVVVSPWSAGGRVCSDVLDHTSLIRIIERRFGVREANISAFRRRTCGDFTSALRFSGPPAGYPRAPQAITLAAAHRTAGVFAHPAPQVAAANQPAPRQ